MAGKIVFDTDVYNDIIGDDRKVEAEITRLSKQSSSIKDQAKETAKSYRDARKEVDQRIEYLLGVHGMKKQEAA